MFCFLSTMISVFDGFHSRIMYDYLPYPPALPMIFVVPARKKRHNANIVFYYDVLHLPTLPIIRSRVLITNNVKRSPLGIRTNVWESAKLSFALLKLCLFGMIVNPTLLPSHQPHDAKKSVALRC